MWITNAAVGGDGAGCVGGDRARGFEGGIGRAESGEALEAGARKRQAAAYQAIARRIRTRRDGKGGRGREELEESVELAHTSLNQTGKNPRKSPKYFKQAEIATRDLLRRLDSFQGEMSFDDRPMLDGEEEGTADPRRAAGRPDGGQKEMKLVGLCAAAGGRARVRAAPRFSDGRRDRPDQGSPGAQRAHRALRQVRQGAGRPGEEPAGQGQARALHHDPRRARRLHQDSRRGGRRQRTRRWRAKPT